MGSLVEFKQQTKALFSNPPLKRVGETGIGTAVAAGAYAVSSSSPVACGFAVGAAVAIEVLKRKRGLSRIGTIDATHVQQGLLIGAGVFAAKWAISSVSEPDWDAILYEDNFRYCTPQERAARTASGLREPSPFLNPEAEVCGNASGFATPGDFVSTIVGYLLELGLSPEQAITITAHLALETGFGRRYNGNNIGGVGVTRGWAERYKARTGRDAPFWRAPGHTGQGDAPTMFFRAYPSIKAFLIEFVRTFAPRPQAGAEIISGRSGNYSGAGNALWNGGDWFRELLLAHYRGDQTAANPENSIAQHRSLERTVRRLYAESRLGLRALESRVDPRLATSLADFQRSRWLVATSEPDNDTIAALPRAA